MGSQVGVVGGSGYAGAELLRLLAAHPSFEVAVVAGASSAGRDLSEVFPSLGRAGEIVASEPANLAGCDVVFLATPHEASLALAPALLDGGAVVIDLSGAFRTDAATFADWYGLPHTAPQLAPAPYGLPELFRADVAGARLVANPGCYPTAALLALAPLAGLVDPTSVVVTGMSGWSGAGKGLRDDLHAPHADGNVAAYGAPRHRHTAEIEATWNRLTGRQAPLTFTPHLVPMARGLLCTVTATLADAAPAAVRDAVHSAYADEPFVRVTDSWPQTAHVRGGNSAAVGVAVDERTGRVTASCAIDNLVKGAAGQALQNANVACGVPETDGLSAAAVYP